MEIYPIFTVVRTITPFFDESPRKYSSQAELHGDDDDDNHEGKGEGIGGRGTGTSRGEGTRGGFRISVSEDSTTLQPS